MSKYLSVKEVCQYLGIGRTTLYRLERRGILPGCKIGHRRFYKRKKVEERKNYSRRIKPARRSGGYYGRIFPAVVLTKYHQAPHKYQIITKDKGDLGWISPREKYLKRLSAKERKREYFKPVKYHRVRLEGGFPIIVVRHRDFARLPRAGKTWWLRFEMSPKRIRQEMEK